MKIKFVFLFLLLILSCSKEPQRISDCSEIKLPFNTYEDLITVVESSKFTIEDKADTSKSSWIRSAKYYSCDGKTGYLIYSTDKQNYIHQNIPIEVWNEFKNADSFGSYYNKNIKGKYRLTPKNGE